jgi:hypothetical protein
MHIFQLTLEITTDQPLTGQESGYMADMAEQGIRVAAEQISKVRLAAQEKIKQEQADEQRIEATLQEHQAKHSE